MGRVHGLCEGADTVSNSDHFILRTETSESVSSESESDPKQKTFPKFPSRMEISFVATNYCARSLNRSSSRCRSEGGGGPGGQRRRDPAVRGSKVREHGLCEGADTAITPFCELRLVLASESILVDSITNSNFRDLQCIVLCSRGFGCCE
jgi:hypothetical protein